MYASRPKIDLDFPFTLQILRIELNREILLLSLGFYEKRITQIVVMQVKHRPIVPIFTRRYSLPVRYSRVLNQDLDVCAWLPVGPAHKAFDRKPVVRFMRRIENGRLNQEGTDTDYCDSNTPPRAGLPDLFPLHSSAPIPSLHRTHQLALSYTADTGPQLILRPTLLP